MERSFASATRFGYPARDHERLPTPMAKLHSFIFACLFLHRAVIALEASPKHALYQGVTVLIHRRHRCGRRDNRSSSRCAHLRLMPQIRYQCPLDLFMMAFLGEFGKQWPPQAGKCIDATDAQGFAFAALVVFGQF